MQSPDSVLRIPGSLSYSAGRLDNAQRLHALGKTPRTKGGGGLRRFERDIDVGPAKDYG